MRRTTHKAWAGRMAAPTHHLVESFTTSLPIDRRLYAQDIAGSIVHCEMLAKQRIIPKHEARRIIAALRQIRGEFERGVFRAAATDEDIHMAVERRLIEKVGAIGGKLHTARSRNDQVALDLRLYLRDTVRSIADLIRGLQRTLAGMARRHADVIMPGYTHLQPAQPVLLAHHLLAYAAMLTRDRERLADCLVRIDVLPLGSGALAGTTFPIDRAYVARKLKFPRISINSMDAVSDRDFALEFLAAGAIMGMHLSRLAEDLILWASQHDLLQLPGLSRIVLSFDAWPTDYSKIQGLNQAPDGVEVVAILPGWPPGRPASDAWNYLNIPMRIVVVVPGPPNSIDDATNLNQMRGLERVIAQMDEPSRSGFEHLQRPLSFRKIME